MRAVYRQCSECGEVLKARAVRKHRCGRARLILSYADGHEVPMYWPPVDLKGSDLSGYMARLVALFRDRGMDAFPIAARIVSAGRKLIDRWQMIQRTA